MRDEMPMQTVEICCYMDGGRLEWCGTATLDSGRRLECSADLPEGVYDQIQAGIDLGADGGDVPAGAELYSWEVRESSTMTD